MHIFYSPNSDPMLLDTGAGLNALYEQLNLFLSSALKDAVFPADITLNPAPYQEFLNGIRIFKTQGLVMLKLSSDHWLELSGAENNLVQYIANFYFKHPNIDNHHHPDNADYMAKDSMRIIIESDSSWGS